MKFINLEACVDDGSISNKDVVNFWVKKHSNFIDDCDEISENVCEYYRFGNVIGSIEDNLEDAFIESRSWK